LHWIFDCILILRGCPIPSNLEGVGCFDVFISCLQAFSAATDIAACISSLAAAIAGSFDLCGCLVHFWTIRQHGGIFSSMYEFTKVEEKPEPQASGSCFGATSIDGRVLRGL
jgi:hypothetical protein